MGIEIYCFLFLFSLNICNCSFISLLPQEPHGEWWASSTHFASILANGSDQKPILTPTWCLKVLIMGSGWFRGALEMICLQTYQIVSSRLCSSILSSSTSAYNKLWKHEFTTPLRNWSCNAWILIQCQDSWTPHRWDNFPSLCNLDHLKSCFIIFCSIWPCCTKTPAWQAPEQGTDASEIQRDADIPSELLPNVKLPWNYYIYACSAYTSVTKVSTGLHLLQREGTYFHWIRFFNFFSIDPTPSRTLVIS